MASQLVAFTDESRKKLSDFLNNIPHNPQGSAVQQPAAMKQSLMPSRIAETTGSSDEYNGYFKLIDISADGACKIAVVDGASYDSMEKTCNPSLAVLDGVKKEFAYQEIAITSTVYIVLEYLWHDKTSSIKTVTSIPASDDSIKYVHIGTVNYTAASGETSASIELTQVHTSGTISFSFSYDGPFKLYRKIVAGETPSYTFHMKGSYIDAGHQTVADMDISFTGTAYLNIHYTVDGTSGSYSFNVKNTTDTVTESDRVVSILIGTVNQYTAVQSHTGSVSLAGSYII